MFERFTERARQVVVFSQEESRKLGHRYIGVEHILLGLIREEEGLAARVLKQLGVDEAVTRAYFKNIKFNLKVVELPPKVQSGVEDAQRAFADISKAQARIQQAAADARANRRRQDGYKQCPTCARIDAIKAPPRGLTALGSAFAVGVK